MTLIVDTWSVKQMWSKNTHGIGKGIFIYNIVFLEVILIFLFYMFCEGVMGAR